MMSEIKERSMIPEKYKWKLEHIYQDAAAWEKDFADVNALVEAYAAYQGHVAETPCVAIREEHALSKRLLRLSYYAMLQREADNGDSAAQAQYDRILGLEVKAASVTSCLVPELLQLEEDKLLALKKEPGMEDFDVFLDELLREKAHILSPAEEKLLAGMGELQQAPDNIFSMLTCADMKFPDVVSSDGTRLPLTNSNYGAYLQSPDRETRRSAFMNLHETYGSYGNTLAATYGASVKKDCFNASARKYSSARAAAMEPLQIPEGVYDGLIEQVHQALPVLQEYLQLRKKVLGLEEMHMYDLYCPLVQDYDLVLPYEKAFDLVLEGLQPMGEDYLAMLRRARDEGWIDVFPAKNKSGGAFSAGDLADVHPYVLLNHIDNLDSAFTIAHELGHSMHSYYSNQTQPDTKADYSLFVAEVASTCNEATMLRQLLKKEQQPRARAYLLNHFLEQFRTTVFRQTMFAEFEKKIHEMSEAGEPLTRETMTEVYLELNRLYYGESCVVDEAIGNEWMRIPHFYSAFYVYVYATGLCAAVALSDRILREGEPAVKACRRFLSAGSSVPPLEALKLAGIDMGSPEPVRQAMQVFRETLEEIKKIIG